MADENIKVRTSMVSMIADSVMSINYKQMFLLFIAFLVISSDVFIYRVLSGVDGAIDANQVTLKGTIVQGIILVLSYILFDTLISFGVI